MHTMNNKLIKIFKGKIHFTHTLLRCDLIYLQVIYMWFQN